MIIPAGCGEETPSEREGNSPDQRASLLKYQGCKTDKQVGKYPELTSDRARLEFSYKQEEETLQILRINAGFNCCPGEISRI